MAEQHVSPTCLELAVSAQGVVVVDVVVVVVVVVVQAEVTALQVQEPQRLLAMPQFTLHVSVQDRPEHWVAQLDWALAKRQHRLLEYIQTLFYLCFSK